tara:strand:+ start:297 stop:815 length:519 start_codon:yes stop_codon:yes gene_type:complete
MDNNQNFDSETEETISKSQRKRDMIALQALGKKLTEINKQLLLKCQLPADLQSAIEEFKRLPNSHEARRRQLQFIGKLMRNIDVTQIESVLNTDLHQVNLNKRFFKLLENLREELLAGSDAALQKLIQDHPELDIQYLRQLIRQAQKEQELKKDSAASKKLFQYLRELKHTD